MFNKVLMCIKYNGEDGVGHGAISMNFNHRYGPVLDGDSVV